MRRRSPLPYTYLVDVLQRVGQHPAAHWIHLRTTNPIESTFATVRLRTVKSRGCGSRASILSTVFKLAQLPNSGGRKCAAPR